MHEMFSADVEILNDGFHEDSVSFHALGKSTEMVESLVFLQIERNSCSDKGPVVLEHDPAWLAVLKATNYLVSTSEYSRTMPDEDIGWDYKKIRRVCCDYTGLLDSVSEAFGGDLEIKNDFQPLNLEDVPASDCGNNPQTKRLCEKLKIHDPIEIIRRRDKTMKRFAELYEGKTKE